VLGSERTSADGVLDLTLLMVSQELRHVSGIPPVQVEGVSRGGALIPNIALLVSEPTRFEARGA